MFVLLLLLLLLLLRCLPLGAALFHS